MTLSLAALEWFLFVFFVAVHAGYLALDAVAYVTVGRALRTRDLLVEYRRSYGLEPPVSVILPAYNEGEAVVASVRAVLQLDYPQFEVVVVNDGSTDTTFAALDHAFSLVPCPRLFQHRLPTAPVRQVYVSATHPMLRVVDKENGGKADALNAGLSVVQYPLYCAVDGDSILQRDSLLRVIRPFTDDPTTIAAGGTVRVLNGSTMADGFLREPHLPRNLLARVQVVEYLRAFLFGRVGWSPLGAVLIISGAFGVFRRTSVIEAGGYRVDTLGEDAELVMRLHRHHATKGVPYRITFVPDPICWTEVPEDLRSLGRQRIRWQRGLAESLVRNRRLLGRAGGAGWLGFPFLVLFECLAPLIELGGYVLLLVAVLAGQLSVGGFLAFLLLAVGLGTLLSLTALLLEERSFRTYRQPGSLWRLAVAAVAENLGYRQLTLVWRVVGLVRFATGRRREWGEITRVAAGVG